MFSLANLEPIALAGFTGVISGLLLSIPVGPINLTIMNEGARRGFAWALLIGAGATAMEVIYCSIAFTGFASLFTGPIVKTSMEIFSFVFMLFLGVKFLISRSLPGVSRVEVRIEERIEEKLHPHSAFMIGLVRTMANLGVLVFWVILAANFISREWVEASWRGKLSCIAGVGIGTGLWFVALSWAVSLGHRKFSDKALLRMERFSGIGLLVIAGLHGSRLIWELAQSRMAIPN